MTKVFSLVLLAGGLLLLFLGVNASHSLSSDISRVFTGSATEKSIWLLFGGVIMTAAGAIGLLRGSNRGV